eukprot:s2858_g3.t1
MNDHDGTLQHSCTQGLVKRSCRNMLTTQQTMSRRCWVMPATRDEQRASFALSLASRSLALALQLHFIAVLRPGARSLVRQNIVAEIMASSGAPVVKGRTLAYPVAADWKPDLKGNLKDITDYLEEQRGYDICDYLMKDRECAEGSGSDDQAASRPPAAHAGLLGEGLSDWTIEGLCVLTAWIGSLCQQGEFDLRLSRRERFARTRRKLAEHHGLVYIGAAELLREAGVDTATTSYAEDEQVSKLVLELIRQAEQKIQGFVVDGFPRRVFCFGIGRGFVWFCEFFEGVYMGRQRTPCQTTFLKEKAVVFTHVLLLKASEEFLQKRQQSIVEGATEGQAVTPELLDRRIKLHAAQSNLALEIYADRTFAIDAEAADEEVALKMEEAVKTRPPSKAPPRPC